MPSIMPTDKPMAILSASIAMDTAVPKHMPIAMPSDM